MRKHNQILNDHQLSNSLSVISIYTLILLWKISVMVMIFVFFFKYSSDIQITFVVIMLIWVASITMTLL